MLSIACFNIQGMRSARPSVRSIYMILPLKWSLCFFKYFNNVFSSFIFISPIFYYLYIVSANSAKHKIIYKLFLVTIHASMQELLHQIHHKEF
ncbi:MAG TPA: hypothetical protein DCP02_04950 [Actinobacteria bacterium]|nr:hypothetical protein [Actinomycetota bacterium]